VAPHVSHDLNARGAQLFEQSVAVLLDISVALGSGPADALANAFERENGLLCACPRFL
jgi:hypothetical protein